MIKPTRNLKVRPATGDDIPALVRLNRAAYPTLAEDNIVWGESHLQSHLRVFPQGQLVAEADGAILGSTGRVWVEAVTQHPLRDSRRLVAGPEARHVDRSLVRTDRQRPWRVGEESHNSGRPASEGHAQIGGIEDPNVSATDAGSGELRITGPGNACDGRICTMLSTMRGRDKGARRRTREDNIARLITYQQCAGDARRLC